MRKHTLLGVSAFVILATGRASLDDTQRRPATGAGVGALAAAATGSATRRDPRTRAALTSSPTLRRCWTSLRWACATTRIRTCAS